MNYSGYFLEGERSVFRLCNYCKKYLTYRKDGIFKTGITANKIYALEFIQRN